MPLNLQRIQLTYDAGQDRLILTFYTQDYYEFRFWVTRRMLKAFWEILQKLQQALLKEGEAHFEKDQQASAHVLQEQQQPDALKYGTPIARHPLGEEPLLLFKILAKPIEQDRVYFSFENLQKQSIEFTGDGILVNVMCQMIRKAVLQTNWDLIFPE